MAPEWTRVPGDDRSQAASGMSIKLACFAFGCLLRTSSEDESQTGEDEGPKVRGVHAPEQ
jgi:hypothetical protein